MDGSTQELIILKIQIAILHSLISTPVLYIFIVPNSQFTRVSLAPIIFGHACTDGTQSAVATGRGPVVVLKVAYAHYGKHFTGHP